MSIRQGTNLIAGQTYYRPDLFDRKWADHILNDVSWLRGDTFSWQDGGVYQAAYNHLVADISGKSLTSETIGSTTVQFYLADDGHKICPASEESNVASIYAATGVAWYYILDTTNQRFKLPRVSPDKANVFDTAPVSVGVYGDGNKLMLRRTSDGATGGLICYASGNPNNSLFSNEFSAYNGTVGISTDPTNSGLVGSGTMTTNGATTHYSGKKYLYFYVGNFTQTALENTAGLNASLFNAKADIDLSNATAENDFVIDRQEPTAQNNYTWYRKYRSGWVEQGGNYAAVHPIVETLMVEMANTEYAIMTSSHTGRSGNNYSKTTTGFSIPNCPGLTTDQGGSWQVSGMAA